MQCPVCDVTLSISSREGVEIDFCPQCRGVWLDRGELDKIIDRAQPGGSRPTGRDDRDDRGRDRDRRDDRDDRDDRDRPRYGDRDRYESRDRRPDDRDRRDPRADTSYDKRKKRRSFLEDIFDFD